MRVTDLSRTLPTHSERDRGSNASGPGTAPADAAVVTRFVAGSITATAWLSSDSGLALDESSPPERAANRSAASPSAAAASAGRTHPRRRGASGSTARGSGAPFWRRRLECRVLRQDRPVQLAEAHARLDAEILDEDPAGALVRGEGVGLPAGPVQGEHRRARRRSR